MVRLRALHPCGRRVGRHACHHGEPRRALGRAHAHGRLHARPCRARPAPGTDHGPGWNSRPCGTRPGRGRSHGCRHPGGRHGPGTHRNRGSHHGHRDGHHGPGTHQRSHHLHRGCRQNGHRRGHRRSHSRRGLPKGACRARAGQAGSQTRSLLAVQWSISSLRTLRAGPYPRGASSRARTREEPRGGGQDPEMQKGGSAKAEPPFRKVCSAASYSPTPSPVQYHRR